MPENRERCALIPHIIIVIAGMASSYEIIGNDSARVHKYLRNFLYFKNNALKIDLIKMGPGST